MSEKRYLVKGYGVAPNGENIFGIFDSRTKSPYHLYVFNDDGLNKIARILNEQQATINELTKNRDRWRELAKLHNGYFNCLEKAIEKAYEEKPYPKIEDIMDIYSELEKEFEDE